MRSEQFIHYLNRPDLLDQSTVTELKEIIDDYPYFPVARMLYLRNLKNINSYKFEQELSKHAIFVPDRALLYRLLDVQSKENDRFELLPYDQDTFRHFLQEKPEISQDELTYISNYQIEDVFQLIDTPAEEELRPDSDSSSDLIDQFISGRIANEPLMERTPDSGKLLSEQSSQIREDLITETLANIYLKQGLYQEALNSYEKLSLKFPEKNSYFAAQIEKIEKLISKES